MNGDSQIRMRLSMTTQNWRDSKGPSFPSDFRAHDPDQLSITTVILSSTEYSKIHCMFEIWCTKKVGHAITLHFYMHKGADYLSFG